MPKFDPVEVVIREAESRSARLEHEDARPTISMLEVTIVYARIVLEEAIVNQEPVEKIEAYRAKAEYFKTLNDRANDMVMEMGQAPMN